MANANTVAGLYGLAGPISATETAVQSPVGVMNPSGCKYVWYSSSRYCYQFHLMFLAESYDGKPFKLRVVAQGVASGACNFTVNVYWNSLANTNLTTFTSDVLVIGSGAQALASKSGVVFMEATLMWDSTLQQLAGFWNESAGASDIPTTPAVIKTTSAVTATSPITGSTAITKTDQLEFFVTFTMSANATSSKLIEFALDRI
jgi:hypothetical protein